MNLTEAIRIVVEAGLSVENEAGGYVSKWGEVWIHQRSFRSTDDYPDIYDAIRSFLRESNLED